MNICEHLAATAKLFPKNVALRFEGQRLTYEQLDTWAVHAASVLKDRGVSPGDRVALMLPNVPAFAVWYFGILRIGAIAVSISTRLSEKEVHFVLSDSGASVLVSDAPSLQRQQASLPDARTAQV